ncbi:putative NADH:ubiquinone reductase [Tanacetum coccineum]
MNLSRWRNGIAMDSYGASRNKQIQSDDELLRGKREGAFPAAYFAKRWQERNDLAQTYLNNLKAWPGLKEEESQPCRKADRRVGWSGMRSYGKEYITASLIREFLMIAVFRMLDPLLFYVLPESVLIPMLCGAEHLIFAGIKLFLCRGLVQ